MDMTATDIFANWKNRRFVIADQPARDFLGDDPPGHLVIFTDFKFWADHVDQLISWCEQHALAPNGRMTLEIPTDQLLTAFVLRWS